MESRTAEASVASVRDQVKSLVSRRGRAGTAARRVYVRRVVEPTPCWFITVKIMEADARHVPNLSFSNERVELDDKRIVVPEPDILIISEAGLKEGTLTLCLRLVRDAKPEPGKENEFRFVETVVREKLNEPARKIAATRALRAVSKAIANSSIQALTDAASASSDVEVAVRALQQPDAIETLQADDPLGPARLRGLRERERLLTLEGGTLPVDEVAKHLGITRQAVNKRRQQETLVGLDAGRHGYRYPAWQFVREGTLPGLDSVLAALEQHDPWMRHIFMVSRNARLNDRTPLEEMRQGRLDDVVNAARAFGEHGAA